MPMAQRHRGFAMNGGFLQVLGVATAVVMVGPARSGHAGHAIAVDFRDCVIRK